MGVTIFMLLVFVLTLAWVLNVEASGTVAPAGGPLKVYTERGKESTRFRVPIALDMSLTLEALSGWRRLLCHLPFFRPPVTGDARFDARFCVIAYRDDVLELLRKDAVIRTIMLGVAQEVPAYSMLGIERGSLYLDVATVREAELERALHILGIAAPGLLASFSGLPPDTPRQAAQRKRESLLLTVPLVSAVSVFFVAMLNSPPLAATAGVWQYQLFIGLIFFVLHMGVVACCSKQAVARMNLTAMVVLTSLFFGIFMARSLVVEINASKVRTTLVAVSRVEWLNEFSTPRSSSRYYLALSPRPESLITDPGDKTGTSMEIDLKIFQSLVAQKVDKGSVVAIKQEVGCLGLPYVTWVGPVRNDDGQLMHRP